MNRHVVVIIFPLLLVLTQVLTFPSVSLADSPSVPKQASSVFDLVNAVNAVRASNGLPAYSINPILMFTAQNQADFMAATGTVTHSGPGGVDFTSRLLAAGYPLAGDLSLGGFRAENITSGSESMSADAAVNQWTGDAPHLNTMLSPYLTEIGAGVSILSGRVYYVIDAARPTTGGAPQVETPLAGDTGTIPAVAVPIPVVVLNTPDQSGDVVHEVLSGQTLWQIAIAYGVKIDDIKRLNNLFDDSIYPGEKLLVAKMAAPTQTIIKTPSPAAIIFPISTSTYQPTIVPITATPDPIADAGVSPKYSSVIVIMIGIVALAILGGGLFSWLGNTKRD
jgi:uncharacterized protein YkwD/LysM repeat protein